MMKNTEKILLLCTISFLVAFCYFGFFWLPSHYQWVEKQHTIIDKYQSVYNGFTHYNLLLEDNSTEWVSYVEWRSLNIGDSYNVSKYVFTW